jgi:uncharacterized flavoprotein (TIGR03862 family)
MQMDVAVIGAGPAGLMAAERLAAGGVRVTVFDRMASPARKLLMAGRGGLNLTHSEPLDSFLEKYGPARNVLEPAIRAFPPAALIAWCNGLGIETFVGSSGRVFPRALKASPLLRAWLKRLSGLGVSLRLDHCWTGETEGFAATILALGGASWPRLGSDAGWVPVVEARGIRVEPFRPSNSGILIGWPDFIAERFAGTPLKRIAVTCGGRIARGELIITAKGLEGGPIYALSRELRNGNPLTLDLRPDLSLEKLRERLSRPRGKMSVSNWLRKSVGLAPAAIALLRSHAAQPSAEAIKALPLAVKGFDSLGRAISSAGGIALSEIDANFELKRWADVYAIGEMLDWEAPTGGYLLQACFAMGVHTARACLDKFDQASVRAAERP